MIILLGFQTDDIRGILQSMTITSSLPHNSISWITKLKLPIILSWNVQNIFDVKLNIRIGFFHISPRGNISLVMGYMLSMMTAVPATIVTNSLNMAEHYYQCHYLLLLQ